MTTTLDDPQSAVIADEAMGQWRSCRLASTCLRILIVCVPLTVATVLGLTAGLLIGGGGVMATIARIALAGVVSLSTFVALERLSRRFLPLAMLLRLSLVFPDRAPSRFSVALRSTSVKKLQQWASNAQHNDGPAALAEKVVILAAALNTHDRRTRGHSDRSRAMAELIAVEMGLSDVEVKEVRWGAFLHDIGKILVPATLLNKPGKPTPSEWETLKQHPVDGANLVGPLRGFLGTGVEAVRGHHENFDGSGYPDGLVGSDIPLAARIVAVADSFEVMTAVRSYKKAMKATDARNELARNSGSQFDPAVVRALLNVSLGKVHWSLGLAAWLAEVPILTFLPRMAAQASAWAAGPTVSVGTLSGVAALSLGTMVASGGMAGSPPPARYPAIVATSTSQSTPPSSTPSSGTSIGLSVSVSSPTSVNSAVSPPAVPAAPAVSAAQPTPAARAPAPTSPSSPPASPISPPPPSVAQSPPPSLQPGPAILGDQPSQNGNSDQGNPHQSGQMGNPHQPGQHGNPHDSGQSGGGG